MTITEATSRIKGKDRREVRSVPQNPMEPFGKQLLQILESNGWMTLVEVDDRKTADTVLSQAVNRTICG